MGDRGRFSGFNWHFEYHTTDPKKEKAANCVYLTTDRICENKKSYNYLEKCFIASTCPLRVKEKKAELSKKNMEEPAPQKQSPEKKVKCSLPMRCRMCSNKFGQGRYVDFKEDGMIISVQFEGGKIVRFLYPDAILEKHLIVSEAVFKLVLQDVFHTE